MPLDLTPGQQDLASKLSEYAKDACKLVDLQCQKCEPRHFYLTVHRYYGRVQGMMGEIDRCIDWCMSKGKLVFTAQRFGKWCANQAKWDREKQITKNEMDTLQSGTIYQQAEYRRRLASRMTHA